MKKRKIVTLSVVIIVIALLLEASLLKYVNDRNAYRTSKVLIDRVITVLNKNDKSKNELIADVVALLQSPTKNVVSALQSGANTIHGVLKTLGERPE